MEEITPNLQKVFDTSISRHNTLLELQTLQLEIDEAVKWEASITFEDMADPDTEMLQNSLMVKIKTKREELADILRNYGK